MSLELGHSVRHHLFRIRYTELNEIYWFMGVRSFALALITIFVPIYLYKVNYGVSNIFLYYVAVYFVEFLSELPAARYIKSHGPKHSMIISLPFMIIHIWQLLTLSKYHWSPVLLAITLGISLALFWEGYHYDFSRSKHAKKTTREVGKLFIMMTLIGASAPLLGGIMATYLGVEKLLMVVIALLFGGSFILLKTRDTNFRKGTVDLRKINFGNIGKHLVAYSGLGWETVASNQIWPLFLFLIIGSYSTIGLITSVTLFASVLVTYWVSKRADKQGRVGFLKIGSLATAVVSVLHVFVESTLQAFMVNTGRSLTQSIFKPPFDSEYYLHADEESRSEYIYIMESTVDIARLVFYLILYILSLTYALPTVLIIGLLLGAFGSALVALMPAAKCEICGEIINKEIKVARRVNA